MTSLIGGTRVPKHHLRINAYGTVDELNSWIGLIRSQAIDAKSKEMLAFIQDRLFTLGSSLASDPVKSKMNTPDLKEEDVTALEKETDRMNETLPELKNFILPGDNPVSSHCHIARCVCRRSERIVTHLNEMEPVDGLIIRYLNRLSDYLFVLARKVSKDLGTTEITWRPRG